MDKGVFIPLSCRTGRNEAEGDGEGVDVPLKNFFLSFIQYLGSCRTKRLFV